MYAAIDALGSFASRKQAALDHIQGGNDTHNVINFIMQHISEAREFAAMSPDASLRNNIAGENYFIINNLFCIFLTVIAQLDEIETTIEPTTQAVNNALNSPKDEAVQQILKTTLNDVVSKLSKLNKSSGQATGKDGVKSSVTHLNECMKSLRVAEQQSERAKDSVLSAIQTGKAQVKQTRDVKTRTIFLEIVDKLEKLGPIIGSAIEEDIQSVARCLREEFPQFVSPQVIAVNENAKKMLTVVPPATMDVKTTLAEVKTGNSTTDYNLIRMVQRMNDRVVLARTNALQSKNIEQRTELIELSSVLENWQLPLIQGNSLINIIYLLILFIFLA